jgi:glycosyltransferase involved in cell wall biosynthesis
MKRPLVAIVILTQDEQENLPSTVASFAGLDHELFIVDSGSTDATEQIATRAGAQVVHHAFTSHADQLNWALDNLPITAPWVMRLDADERVTPELVDELSTALAAAPRDVIGFMLKRRVYFWGRWIKHGGYYPTWLFRVWRRGAARSEQRWMDEHMVSSGRVLRLEHDIIDENHKGLTFWTDKHNRYADREVKDQLAAEEAEQTGGVAGQAARRRWMKQNVYARSPRFARASAYWFLRYFLLLGFLDGKPGLVFHFLQGFWYRFLVDAKLEERQRAAPTSVAGAITRSGTGSTA